MHTTRIVAVSCLSLALLAGCAARAPRATATTGSSRVSFERIDDLLTLQQRTDLELLVLEDTEPTAVSEAHITRLREWVQGGGVLWAAGEGLDSALVKELVPVTLNEFPFAKSSTGDPGGELVVKGVSPRLVIEDHALTTGVTQLYLFPQRRVDGTKDLQPLVRMTDTRGTTGVVLGAVPLGRGLVILDGTARAQGFLFGRIEGFDDDHPNAVEQNGTWNAYDWATLEANARAYARRARTGQAPAPAAALATGGSPSQAVTCPDGSVYELKGLPGDTCAATSDPATGRVTGGACGQTAADGTRRLSVEMTCQHGCIRSLPPADCTLR